MTNLATTNVGSLAATDDPSGPSGGQNQETKSEGPNPLKESRKASRKSSSGRGALSGPKSLGKNGFLELLVTQLKNQNPSKPMEGRKFASQLAKFSSLEQLNRINDQLKGQKQSNQRLAQSINSSVATDLVGKRAEVSGNKITWDGEKPALIGMELSSRAARVDVKIKGPGGETVETRTLQGLSAGSEEIRWAGTTSDGKTANPGTYEVDIQAKGPDGDAVQVQPYVLGEVSRVSFGKDGPRLEVNGKEISLSKVRSVAPESQ